jgi:hypothetical protein
MMEEGKRMGRGDSHGWLLIGGPWQARPIFPVSLDRWLTVDLPAVSLIGFLARVHLLRFGKLARVEEQSDCTVRRYTYGNSTLA